MFGLCGEGVCVSHVNIMGWTFILKEMCFSLLSFLGDVCFLFVTLAICGIGLYKRNVYLFGFSFSEILGTKSVPLANKGPL